MKIIASLFLALFSSAASLSGDLFSISPAKPRIGVPLTITYDASHEQSVLKKSSRITANILVVPGPSMIEVPMQKDGSTWKGTFTVSAEDAALLAFKFAGDQKIDNNNDDVWDAMIYTAAGVPIRNAHKERATMLHFAGFRNFDRIKDIEAAWKESERELTLYPDNWHAETQLLDFKLRKKPQGEELITITKALGRLEQKLSENEEACLSIAGLYAQAGMDDKADALRADWIEKNPAGAIAKQVRTTEFSDEAEMARRIELAEALIRDFPETKATMERQLVLLPLRLKQYEKAIAAVESMQEQDGNLYNRVAWTLISAGEMLDKAAATAEKGIAVLRQPVAAGKPGYMSNAEWEESRAQSLAMILDTYAYGLEKLERLEEAMRAYDEAFVLGKGQSEDTNERYVALLVRTEQFEKARAVADESIRKGRAGGNLFSDYKKAFAALNGSADGFELEVAKAKDFARASLEEKILDAMIKRPAPDFTLASLDAPSVTLSKLKGKVVIVDFWATWCGPCVRSFPFLQQVYEKYEKNPQVAILALDTWEDEEGTEREAVVRKFIKENKYTFPVLFDTDFVDKYGVRGIPTKFVIGKDGNIRFKSVGFSGGLEMMNELNFQIEMLLAEKLSEK